MDTIKLTTKLSIDDYVNINFHLLYRKWTVKLLTGIGLFTILMGLLGLLTSSITEIWPQFILGIFFIGIWPIQTYFLAKRNYNSNGRVSEIIIYEFDDELLSITGESFSSKLTWDKVFKLTENKNWVLVWQDQLIANVIPKRDFLNDDYNAFKEIVRKHPTVKNKLNIINR